MACLCMLRAGTEGGAVKVGLADQWVEGGPGRTPERGTSEGSAACRSTGGAGATAAGREAKYSKGETN